MPFSLISLRCLKFVDAPPPPPPACLCVPFRDKALSHAKSGACLLQEFPIIQIHAVFFREAETQIFNQQPQIRHTFLGLPIFVMDDLY